MQPENVRFKKKLKAISVILVFCFALFLISLCLNILQSNLDNNQTVTKSFVITLANTTSYMAGSTTLALIFALLLPASTTKLVNYLRETNRIPDEDF
jgi:TRAP-type C4-dicarboxylate transport system permease small subunit